MLVLDKNGVAPWRAMISAEEWDAAHPDRAPHRLVPMVETAELERAVQDRDELSVLTKRQSDLLTGVANALRGEPDELTLWSHHDLPQRAAEARKSLAESEARCAALVKMLDEARSCLATMTIQLPEGAVDALAQTPFKGIGVRMNEVLDSTASAARAHDRAKMIEGAEAMTMAWNKHLAGAQPWQTPEQVIDAALGLEGK
jgi:hypothetical protein